MKILAIGAHPDDVEIGCGGTLLYLKSVVNAEIHVLLMTRGTKGNCDVDSRKLEQEQACKILGVTRFYCPELPDTNITIKAAIDVIEELVNVVNPNYIWTHYKDDTHQDHRIVAEATISACRNRSNVLYYESFSSENFNPMLFVDIEGTLQSKCEVVAAHKTQEERLHLVDYVKMLAKQRAHRTGLKYVEGFIPRKFIWKKL
jgi:LmbE family N-acetylglucosaminyl deacetylase